MKFTCLSYFVFSDHQEASRACCQDCLVGSKCGQWAWRGADFGTYCIGGRGHQRHGTGPRQAICRCCRDTSNSDVCGPGLLQHCWQVQGTRPLHTMGLPCTLGHLALHAAVFHWRYHRPTSTVCQLHVQAVWLHIWVGQGGCDETAERQEGATQSTTPRPHRQVSYSNVKILLCVSHIIKYQYFQSSPKALDRRHWPVKIYPVQYITPCHWTERPVWFVWFF